MRKRLRSRFLPVALAVVASLAASCASGPVAGVIPVTGIGHGRVGIYGPSLGAGRVKVTVQSLAGVNPDWVALGESWTQDPEHTHLTPTATGFEGYAVNRVYVGAVVSLQIEPGCNAPCAWEQSSQEFLYTVTIVP